MGHLNQVCDGAETLASDELRASTDSLIERRQPDKNACAGISGMLTEQQIKRWASSR